MGATPDTERAEALTEAEMKELEERFDPEVLACANFRAVAQLVENAY